MTLRRIRRLARSFALPVLALTTLSACDEAGAPSPAPTPSTAGPAFTALAGDAPPRVALATDLGRLDPDRELVGVSLLFRRSPAQEAASRALLEALADPTSPSYHVWRTPGQVAESFGAAPADVAAASAWLASQGFVVHGTSPTRSRLFFSGTVGALERAFQTEMHRYELHGASHFALARAPSVPTALSRFVLGLRGVHDFHMHPMARASAVSVRPAYLEDGGAPGDALTMAPSDFAAIYDLTPVYDQGLTGRGQNLAVVGESDFNDQDILAFRADFGLDTSLIPIRDVVPYSGASYVSSPDFFLEAELDLEWSGAIAKEATVSYVYTGSNPTYDVFDAIAWAIDEGKYPVITASYSDCEGYFTPAEDIYLAAMGDAASMEGVTLVSASGDWGPASCDAIDPLGVVAARYGIHASWPATVPSVTAVGGTMLSWGDPIPEGPVTSATAGATPFSTYWSCTFDGPAACAARGYVPETGWNETSYQIAGFKYFWGASGGGTSALFARPSWQAGITPIGSMRAVPDVSLSAAASQVGYAISLSWTTADGPEEPPRPEGLTINGGTSVAAPSFAGILALTNEALAKAHPAAPPGLGNANPVLYAIEASTRGDATPAFHDITTGDSLVPCAPASPDCPSSPPYQFGYKAGPGYDLVTGLGSIDARALVTAWTSLTPTAITLAVKTSGKDEGATATMTATVASKASTTPLSGSVIFYADTTDDGLAQLAVEATGSLTPTTGKGGTQGGTATASVVVPPGLIGQANVVAFYGGDDHYLASYSSPASTLKAHSTLAVAPSAITVNPNEVQVFTTSGGVAPVQWTLLRDSTCGASACARLESLTPTSGIYQAGPEDGASTIAAIDADGAIVLATISVTGSPVDGGPFPPPYEEGGAPDAGDGGDAGGADDAGGAADATADGATEASDERPPPRELGENNIPPPGCSCRAAGSAAAAPVDPRVLLLVLACLLSARRRRAAT